MNKVVVPARKATQPGGIGSLESILGLLKSLKIRAQDLFQGIDSPAYVAWRAGTTTLFYSVPSQYRLF
jgi:hypothetical protein